MTFGARTLGYLAASNVPNTLSCNAVASDIGITTSRVSFYTNGTIDYIDPALSSGSTAWYLPTGGTPGNSYWIKITVVSGSTPTGMTSGTLYALSATRALTLTRTSVGTSTSSGNIDIYSDAGGTTRVGGGSYTMSTTFGI